MFPAVRSIWFSTSCAAIRTLSRRWILSPKKTAGWSAISPIRVRSSAAKAGDSLAVLCLGPVSVLPERQRAGVGSALIRHSLEAARNLGFPAVFLYGDPRYYHRFGFRCAEKYDIRTEDGFYAAALHALELKPAALADAAGRFAESPGYAVDEKTLAAFDAGFAPKHREETPSQQEFRFLASLRY